MKAIIDIEKFAGWFLELIGLSLVKREGIVATFAIREDFGELESQTLRNGKNNKIILDMESWKTIFNKYLEYKSVNGYVISLTNNDSKYCGMSIVALIGGQLNNYDGIHFTE